MNETEVTADVRDTNNVAASCGDGTTASATATSAGMITTAASVATAGTVVDTEQDRTSSVGNGDNEESKEEALDVTMGKSRSSTNTAEATGGVAEEEDDFQVTEEDFKGQDEVTRVYHEVEAQEQKKKQQEQQQQEQQEQQHGELIIPVPMAIEPQVNSTAASASTTAVHQVTGNRTNQGNATSTNRTAGPRSKQIRRRAQAAQQFYALRKGKTTQNCIYLNWIDIQPQLENDHSQYRAFDDWNQAMEFIQNNHQISSATSIATTATNHSTVAPSDVAISIHNALSWDHVYSSLQTYFEEKGNSNVPLGTSLGEWVAQQRKDSQEQKLTASQIDKLKKLNFCFDVADAGMETATTGGGRTKRITFEERVREWVQYKQDNGGKEPSTSSLLYKWAASMRKRYRDHLLDDDKMHKLEEIGFTFENKRGKKNQAITPMDTTTDGVSGGGIDAENGDTTMSGTVPDKSDNDELEEDGRTWDDFFEDLKKYKEEHGHSCPPTTINTPLKRWTDKQRIRYRRKDPSLSTPKDGVTQLEKLRSVAFVFERKRGRRSTIVNDSAQWDDMYESLKEFKKKNGHCVVPTQPPTALRKWVEKQRTEYKKIRAGEESSLSLMRLQKLNDIEFPFESTQKVKTWDERFEELVEFKKKFGHCKVPRLYNTLGKWVADQRQKYSRWKQGKKSNMTEARAKKLTDIGMIWAVFKLPPVEQRAERKPWDFRFKQLLEYKKENGHTVVPQHYPVLGQWVHSQRVNYKLMKQGRKTLMTPEQAIMLVDVGFAFEVMPRKKDTVMQSLGNPYPHLPLIGEANDAADPNGATSNSSTTQDVATTSTNSSSNDNQNTSVQTADQNAINISVVNYSSV